MIRFRTTKDQLHQLAEATHKRGRLAHVDKQALANLISDHGAAVKALPNNSYREPEEAKS